MATQLRLRRGNTAQTAVFTGALAEITVDTEKKTIVIHDGVTPGGFPLPVTSDLSTGSAGYNRANSAFAQANLAYNKANSANILAQAAFDSSNTKFNSSGGTITGDVNLVGNLTVRGTTVSVDTNTITTDDSLIKLAKNNTTDAVDIGFYAPYNSSYTGFVRDSADGNYYLFKDLATDPSGNNVSNSSLTIAGLKANLITEVITLRGLDPLDYANTIKSGAEANTGAALISAKSYTDTANTNLKNYVDVEVLDLEANVGQLRIDTQTANSSLAANIGAARIADQSASQANVGSALISAKSYTDTANTNLKNYVDVEVLDLEANVGAGLISAKSTSEANVGAGLISLNTALTSAYQANVGAGLLTVANNYQANVGEGLISLNTALTSAYQANVGDGLITTKSNYEANVGAGLITTKIAYEANVGAGRIADQSASQANVGAGLISLNTALTSAYQANVGAGRIADQSASQANVGAGLITYSTNAEANTGAALITAKAYTDSANANLKNYIDVANNNLKNYVDVANTNLKNYVDTNIVNGIEANVGAGIIATQANVGAGLIANALDSQANTGAGVINAKAFTQTVYDSSNTKFSSSGGLISGNVEITGNLIVSGNTTIVSANNLVVKDNMLYMNDGANVATADIGIVGAYVNNGYKHSGIFRDYSDGVWKVFDNYTPEPDESPNIDTTNTSFRIGNFTANIITDIINVRGLDPLDRANIALTTGQLAFDAANSAIIKTGDTVTGVLNVTNTTTSTSKTTGAIVVAGGMGVSGNVYANVFHGNVNISQPENQLLFTGNNNIVTSNPHVTVQVLHAGGNEGQMLVLKANTYDTGPVTPDISQGVLYFTDSTMTDYPWPSASIRWLQDTGGSKGITVSPWDNYGNTNFVDSTGLSVLRDSDYVASKGTKVSIAGGSGLHTIGMGGTAYWNPNYPSYGYTGYLNGHSYLLIPGTFTNPSSGVVTRVLGQISSIPYSTDYPNTPMWSLGWKDGNENSPNRTSEETPGHKSIIWDRANRVSINEANLVSSFNVKGNVNIQTLSSNTTGIIFPDSSFQSTAAYPLSVSEEGSSVSSTTKSINFVGSSVTATASGNNVTVTIDALPISGGTLSGPVNTSVISANSVNVNTSVDIASSTKAIYYGNVQETVDSWPLATYRSAKYIAQISSTTSFQLIELNLIHDSASTVYLSQFGEVRTGSSLGTFDATISGSNVNLLFTATNASTTVKFVRTLIVI